MTRRRWRRGVPGEEQPPVAVGDALAEVGAELGLADPRWVSALTTRWPEIVGPAIAEHARFRSLRGTVLTVVVESGPWATQLRYLERDVLERVAGIVGREVVTEIRVVVDAHGGHDASSEHRG